MPILEVADISKTFHVGNGNSEIRALNCVNASLGQGNILCLLGPSGCGKTTLLRIVAGLERPDTGKIVFDGEDMAGTPPHLRRFSMMFQEFALFPHKNVFENVAFGLRMMNRPGLEIKRKTGEMLALVGLDGMETRNVNELSGGERQRVALARSLAYRPRLVLLDEPLGSLDRAMRERLVPDIRRILKDVRVTAVFVTHDQTEAFAIADIVAVLHNGGIEQIDSPENLYKHPANPTVAKFLGFHNRIEGIINPNGGIDTEIGTLCPETGGLPPGTGTAVLVRPEAARLADKPGPGETEVFGVVKERIFQGRAYRVTLETKSGRLLVFDLPNDDRPPDTCEPIRLILKPSAMSVMDYSSFHMS